MRTKKGDWEMPGSYPISALDGCDTDMIADLKSTGIRTTARLLERAKDPKGRKALAAITGINEKQILRWANQADRMRIKGIGKEHAELLHEIVGDTPAERVGDVEENLHFQTLDLFRPVESWIQIAQYSIGIHAPAQPFQSVMSVGMDLIEPTEIGLEDRFRVRKVSADMT